MPTDSTIQIRLDARTKEAANDLFSRLGLSTSDAIRIFINQSLEEQGLPFRPHVANAETKRALEAARQGQLTDIDLKTLKRQWDES